MFCQVEGSEVVKVIPHPIPITIENIQYPKVIFNRWSKQELKAIGLLPYRENKVDHRFYLRGDLSYEVGSDEVVGTYAKTGKDIDVLKSQMIKRVKKIASTLLTPTDWMVIRESEDSDQPMADDIKAYRTAVRKESNDKETEIKALSDLDAAMLYEATPCIDTRKNDAGEEVESECLINSTNHYFTLDPFNNDPSFVSLVKK